MQSVDHGVHFLIFVFDPNLSSRSKLSTAKLSVSDQEEQNISPFQHQDVEAQERYSICIPPAPKFSLLSQQKPSHTWSYSEVQLSLHFAGKEHTEQEHESVPKCLTSDRKRLETSN